MQHFVWISETIQWLLMCYYAWTFIRVMDKHNDFCDYVMENFQRKDCQQVSKYTDRMLFDKLNEIAKDTTFTNLVTMCANSGMTPKGLDSKLREEMFSSIPASLGVRLVDALEERLKNVKTNG
jgi:hypothetical protein